MVAARNALRPARLWPPPRASGEQQARRESHQLSVLRCSRIQDRLERLECEWSCLLLRRDRMRYLGQARSDCFAEIHGSWENSRRSRIDRIFHQLPAELMPYLLRRAAQPTPPGY